MATPDKLLTAGTAIVELATSRTAVIDESGVARFEDGSAWPRSEVIAGWKANRIGYAQAGRKRQLSIVTPAPTDLGLIAGRVRLHDAMRALAERRPMFHSEADFQFALAQTVTELDKKIEVRLERPVDIGGAMAYLDLHCEHDGARTAIELKHFTQWWKGEVLGEAFALKHHSARDLARKGFVKDVARLEKVVADRGGNGLAVMLTNDQALWLRARRQNTRDINFHIHDGATLSGHLPWGFEDSLDYAVDLRGSYETEWRDYSESSGDYELRYVMLETEPSA